jgi:nicotinic acid mononucleotide adenylyltransferase
MTDTSFDTAVALFGLSADPPTGEGGHAGIVRWCATTLVLPARGAEPERPIDEVWVLPVYRHMFRDKAELTPYEHRLAMARLAFEKLGSLRARVRVLELERTLFEERARAAAPGSAVRLPTFDVVTRLREDHPRTRFALVLGADTYADLAAGKWYRAAQLRQLVEVVPLPRRGFTTVASAPGAPSLEQLSSSELRATTDLEALRRALQPEVLAYVLAHGLYAVGAAHPR